MCSTILGVDRTVLDKWLDKVNLLKEQLEMWRSQCDVVTHQLLVVTAQRNNQQENVSHLINNNKLLEEEAQVVSCRILEMKERLREKLKYLQSSVEETQTVKFKCLVQDLEEEVIEARWKEHTAQLRLLDTLQSFVELEEKLVKAQTRVKKSQERLLELQEDMRSVKDGVERGDGQSCVMEIYRKERKVLVLEARIMEAGVRLEDAESRVRTMETQWRHWRREWWGQRRRNYWS